MDKRIQITVGSDTDYEGLIAEIDFQEQTEGDPATFCRLDDSEGYGNLMIELRSFENQKKLVRMPIIIFEEALVAAKKRLWELKKETMELP